MKLSLLPLLLSAALLAASPALLAGQTPCGAAYTRIVAEGDALFKKGKYKDAFEKFRAARGCTEAEHQMLDQKVEDVLRAVDGEREKADRSAAMARQQQKKAEAALKRAEEETAKAEAAEQKATAVLDKIYFYEGRFGLAYAGGSYGFIDKNLNTKIAFRYTEALPFDHTGFAWVKGWDDNDEKQLDFLIDTLGNEYPLASDVEELNETTTALDLRNRNIDTLSSVVFRNPQLKVLLLGENKLMQLPRELGNLKNLIFLGLSRNKLEQLPRELGNLENLKSLQVSENRLKELPPELWDLKNLISLDLRYNQLTHLPQAVGNLQNLTSLDLSSNKLAQLPPEVGELKNLTSLDLSFNQLTQLPPALGNLKNLTSLRLGGNRLTQLPPALGNLKNLTSLDLGSNQLTQLPSELGNLKNLTSLDLSGNRLVQLPQELGDLKNLTSLELSGNRLVQLPQELGDLKILTRINLEDNPIPLPEQKRIQTLLPYCEIYFELPEEKAERLKKENAEQRDQYAQQVQSAEAKLQIGDTTISKIGLANRYNDLAWHQLLSGQFSEAERSLRRGLELDSTVMILYSNLPPALLFQDDPAKEAEALRLYAEWKNKDYDPPRYPKYRDVFLDDLKAFEAASIIPAPRQAAVAQVKKLLEE
ncbi:MAG: leucine-rich repeat domain-containing protein [Saprospiraceae bacterium]